MNTVHVDLNSALKKYFGFSQFKGLQEDVIKSLNAGNNTFVIMPTGGGKSLCYQLPALIKEGTAIIVSPLIALMKNQVDAIRGISKDEGIAHVLNSSLNKTEVKKVKEDITNGVTKLLYVAPESLTKLENIDFLKSVKILSKLDSSITSSSGSAPFINSISSGEYSFVVKTVIRILIISTPAPIINESIKLKGTLPGSAVLEIPAQLVNT